MIPQTDPETAISGLCFFRFVTAREKQRKTALSPPLLRDDLKPASEELFYFFHHRVRIHFGGKLQLVQKLLVIAIQLWLHPQDALKVGCGKAVQQGIIVRRRTVNGQIPSGVVFPQRLQHRTLRELSLVYRVFKSQPEKAFISVRLFILLEGRKHRCDLWIIIVPPYGSDDEVPVKLCVPFAVIGLEIRNKAVILRGVPNLVDSSAPLKIRYRIHIS